MEGRNKRKKVELTPEEVTGKKIQIVMADTDPDIVEISNTLQELVPTASEVGVLRLGENANPFLQFDPEKKKILLVGHSGWNGNEKTKEEGVALFGNFTVNDTSSPAWKEWSKKINVSTIRSIFSFGKTRAINFFSKAMFGSFAMAFNKNFEAAYKQKHEAALKGMNKNEQENRLNQAKEQVVDVYLAGCEAGLMIDIKNWVSSAQHVANDLYELGFKNVVIHTVVNPVLAGMVDMRVGFGTSEGNNVVASYLITSTQNEELTKLTKQLSAEKNKEKITAIEKAKQKIEDKAVMYMRLRYEDFIEELDRPHNMIYPVQRVQEEKKRGEDFATPQKNIWQELVMKSIGDMIAELYRFEEHLRKKGEDTDLLEKEIAVLKALRADIGKDTTGKEWARLIDGKMDELSVNLYAYHWLDGLLKIAETHGDYTKKEIGVLERVANAVKKLANDETFKSATQTIANNFTNMLKTVQAATKKAVAKPPKLSPYSAKKAAEERKAAEEKAKQKAAAERARKKAAEALAKQKEAEEKTKREASMGEKSKKGQQPKQGLFSAAKTKFKETFNLDSNGSSSSVSADPEYPPSEELKIAFTKIKAFSDLLSDELANRPKRLQTFFPSAKEVKSKQLYQLYLDMKKLYDTWDTSTPHKREEWVSLITAAEEADKLAKGKDKGLLASRISSRTKNLFQNIKDGRAARGILPPLSGRPMAEDQQYQSEKPAEGAKVDPKSDKAEWVKPPTTKRWI